MTVTDPKPQPAPAAPPGPPRATLPPAPAAPALPPVTPPAPLAAPAALGGIQPPNTITMPPSSEVPGLTLEEQAEAQAAAAAPAQQPPPGGDVILPDSLGPDWAGKSVADLYAALQETKGTLTQAQQHLALLQAPATAQPPAAPAQPTPPTTAPGTTPPPAAAPQPPAAEEPFQRFNAAVVAYAPIYQQQGNQLSEAQVKAFSEYTGIPEHAVLRGLENEIIRTERDADLVYSDLAGGDVKAGKAAYASMVQWLERNMAREHVAQFNAALDSNDLERIRTTVQTFYSAYQQAGGGPPQFVTGPPAGGPSGATPFTGSGQVQDFLNARTADGRHLRMDVDADYRREYERRMAVSTNPFG